MKWFERPPSPAPSPSLSPDVDSRLHQGHHNDHSIHDVPGCLRSTPILLHQDFRCGGSCIMYIKICMYYVCIMYVYIWKRPSIYLWNSMNIWIHISIHPPIRPCVLESIHPIHPSSMKISRYRLHLPEAPGPHTSLRSPRKRSPRWPCWRCRTTWAHHFGPAEWRHPLPRPTSAADAPVWARGSARNGAAGLWIEDIQGIHGDSMGFRSYDMYACVHVHVDVPISYKRLPPCQCVSPTALRWKILKKHRWVSWGNLSH